MSDDTAFDAIRFWLSDSVVSVHFSCLEILNHLGFSIKIILRRLLSVLHSRMYRSDRQLAE
ncbi:hypothetical protein [Marixanthomonas ophiurae]|uniref:hypothetical protein n=1 Tax=Marixanthomonas ophiurae TaxID=387659 RepID=UPI0013149E57|nr:hypothetical protein [Marixanthomonas ophiurae]